MEPQRSWTLVAKPQGLTVREGWNSPVLFACKQNAPILKKWKNKLLSKINSPEDIKNLSPKELEKLSSQIRKTIIEIVGKNGGHLASNLGVVELTLALHRVFSSPNDAIIFDVSHQCYTHKLLTGRYSKFSSLRQKDGITGFTNIAESEHDYFINGHSSTSISAALGLLTSWELQQKNGKVIAVIGDGALTGGMAFEALSHAGQLCKNLIVVLNDNQMSIDQNTGAISKYLSSLTMTGKYQKLRRVVDFCISKIPLLNKFIEKFVYRFKRSLKGLFLSNNLFVDLGFEYVGPLEGHNIEELERVFKRVKNLRRPVVVHVMTKKGKGYSPAEDKPEVFHGVGPFAISDGTVEKFDQLSFTESFSNSIVELGYKNEKIVTITAAMAKGTGLSAFSRKFPSRFFDVGIAEEHAVTFAAGLAKGGLIPVVCIYSTFMQRAIDQVIHDVSLQTLPVVFVLDRAGAVPGDGCTHQGIFDITLLKSVPNLFMLSVSSAKDLDICLSWATLQKNPVVIRYPKLSCPTEIEEFSEPVQVGRGIFVPCTQIVVGNVSEGQIKNRKNKVLIVATGGMYGDVQKAVRSIIIKKDDIMADIYLLRFIKPFDFEYFYEIAKNYDSVLFVEDGIKKGGISEEISLLLAKKGFSSIRTLGFNDEFYSQGTRDEVCEMAGIDSESIFNSVVELVNK